MLNHLADRPYGIFMGSFGGLYPLDSCNTGGGGKIIKSSGSSATYQVQVQPGLHETLFQKQR